MQIIKTAGKIMGAKLTKNEQRAMMMEIRRELADWDRKNLMEIDAIFLWELHEQFGFGPDRLKRFYDHFSEGIEKLCQRYEMDSDDDKLWLCQKKLKDIGIDVSEWAAEKGVVK